MAVTTYATEYSTQYGYSIARGTRRNQSPDDHGMLQAFRFDFTQGAAAGDATSTQGLFLLPAGRWRPFGMKLSNSAFGSSRTLDLGIAAFVNHDGTAVNADPDYFADDKDVSAALVGWDFNVATAYGIIDNREPVLIYSTVAGGTIPAAATLKGLMAFIGGV